MTGSLNTPELEVPSVKLVSFSVETDIGSVERIGCRHGGTIVDLTAGHARLLHDEQGHTPETAAGTLLPTNMLAFLQRGDRAVETARNVSEFVREADATTSPDGARLEYAVNEVTLHSPLPRPNTLRDCSVYEGHLLNTRDLEPGTLPDAYYEYPVYYNGNPDVVVDPNSEVPWPTDEQRFDYELEIGAVIGTRGHDVSAEDADEYIAGFTIFNDFSARDLQLNTKPLMIGPGKSKDFVSGLGPCLVTRDSIDPTDLAATTRVNGEIWAEGTTDGMYHSWGEIVEYVSAGTTIHPGDVIGSGTIEGGCGLGQDQWLNPGDTIELTVEGIGTLRHTLSKDPSR